LSQNKIGKLDFLVVLSSLKVLDLSNNLITNVSESTFVANQELGVLKLQSNRISMVDPKAFQPLKQIMSLDLSLNPLTMMAETFCGLRNLTYLNLDSTSLSANGSGFAYPGAANMSKSEILDLTINWCTLENTVTAESKTVDPSVKDFTFEEFAGNNNSNDDDSMDYMQPAATHWYNSLWFIVPISIIRNFNVVRVMLHLCTYEKIQLDDDLDSLRWF
jgi:Ran GTPase-activating protein (RanGAP) involved in mRNA processing and transport